MTAQYIPKMLVIWSGGRTLSDHFFTLFCAIITKTAQKK